MARNQRLTKEEIQEDKFIEVVMQTYAFLKDNLRTIIIISGVVLVAVAGYAAYYQNQATRRTNASHALRQATEAYQTAENSLFDAEKLAESEELLKTAQTQLKAVFEKYPNTTFADKARYQYASTFYYQGNYAEARAQFKQIIENHQPESQMESLYAQKAIGNTYEQEADYENAIEAYQAKSFHATPELSPEIRKFVLTEAKSTQALVYEKSGNTVAARDTYKEIIDEFRSALEAGLERKSLERLEEAKEVIAAIGEPLDADVSNPKKLEFALTVAQLNQALAHKKSGDSEALRAVYNGIAEESGHTLEVGLAQNSVELVEEAKVVITAIGEPLDADVSNPKKLEFALTVAQLNQALAHKKSDDLQTSREVYHEIADEFVHALEVDLSQKGVERVESGKVVITAMGAPFDIDMPKAEKLENEKRYFEAYVAYTDAIRTYKAKKDIHGGLSAELRKQIGNFEKDATLIINNVRSARRADAEGRESSALYNYNVVVEFETLGLSRRLYENALFHYKRLQPEQ